MYEYAVDRNSAQFKAPFNQIKNEARRLHLQGHGDRHAQQRHALFVRRGWTCAPSRSCFRSRRWTEALLLGAALRRQHLQLRLYRQPRHRQARPATTWSSGRTGRARPRPGSRRCSGRARSSRWRAIARSSSTPADMDNVKKVQAGYKVQPLSAFLKQPAPPAAPAIDFPKIDKELVKTNFFDYLDFALQFAPAQANEKRDPRQACAHRHRRRARPSTSRTSRSEHKLEIGLGMKEGERKVDEAVAHGRQGRSMAGGSARCRATAPSTTATG